MADNKIESCEADVEASKTVVQKGLDGISILEVYSITYLGGFPLKAEDQIGSISIDTNDMCYYLYYETKVNTSKPSIEHGDQLPMRNVGPICSFTNPKMNFDLSSGKYEGSKKLFSRSPKDGDWLEKQSIKSIDCYEENISVLFGCFSNAKIANLKVMFSPSAPSSDPTTNVYGVVMASNNKFEHPSCTSYLFLRNSASTIQVGHNDVIPLSKSRVGVPLDSKLFVDISLFCDGIPYEGTAKFTPNEKKRNSYVVAKQILVEVTWNCSEDLYSTDEDSDFTDEDSYFTDEFESASECEYSTDDIEKEISEALT